MLQHQSVQLAVYAAYGLLTIAGVALNILLVIVVARSLERKRSVTRMLLVNLALSDLSLLLLSCFSPAGIMYASWPFGELLCKATPSVSSLSTFVSSFSATAIAVHRYLTVADRRRHRLHTKWCMVTVVAIWLVAAALTTPIVVKTQLKRFPNTTLTKCVESWDQRYHGHIFTLVCLVLQFVVPTVVIAVCYSRVGHVLHSRLSFHMSRAYHRNQQRALSTIRRQRRTTRTLTCMVAVYVVSWLPLNAFNVAVMFWFERVAVWRPVTLVYVIAHLLATSSAVCNPVIYIWLNDEFRRQILAKLRRCCSIRLLHVNARCLAPAERYS